MKDIQGWMYAVGVFPASMDGLNNPNVEMRLDFCARRPAV
jgi:hypothetical protein